jgi:hypothetical protein
MVPPTSDEIPLFDVVSKRNAYGAETTYVPTVEMDRAVETAGDFWQATARQAILALLEIRETVSVDDLRRDGLVPEPIHPNAWGGVFAALANAGEIRFVAYRKSQRPASHARVIAVWSKP